MTRWYVVAALLMLALGACKKLKEEVVGNFEITNSSKFTVPATTVVGVDAAFLDTMPPVSTTSKISFDQHGTSSDKIEEVKLKALNVSIDLPSTENFDFLRSIHLYVTAPGQPKLEIAYLDNVPTNVQSIDLIPTDQRMDAYIKQDSYEMTVDAKIRSTTKKAIDMTAKMTFNVKAKLLK